MKKVKKSRNYVEKKEDNESGKMANLQKESRSKKNKVNREKAITTKKNVRNIRRKLNNGN